MPVDIYSLRTIILSKLEIHKQIKKPKKPKKKNIKIERTDWVCLCRFSLRTMLIFLNKATQQSDYRLSMLTTDLEDARGDKGAAYPTGDVSWKLPKHVLQVVA